MNIEQTFTVRASREATAAFFLDIDRVSACIPGVEGVEEVEPGNYRAVLAVRLGPIRAAFQGTMALDSSDAPHRLAATGEGRDRATGSVAKVSFTADLEEEQPGETTVNAVADIALRGRMAQFGTGVMRAAAGEMVEHFAQCANASLAATPQATTALTGLPTGDVAAATAGPAAAPPAPAIVRIVLRSVWKALREAMRDLVSRRRSSRSEADGRRS